MSYTVTRVQAADYEPPDGYAVPDRGAGVNHIAHQAGYTSSAGVVVHYDNGAPTIELHPAQTFIQQSIVPPRPNLTTTAALQRPLLSRFADMLERGQLTAATSMMRRIQSDHSISMTDKAWASAVFQDYIPDPTPNRAERKILARADKLQESLANLEGDGGGDEEAFSTKSKLKRKLKAELRKLLTAQSKYSPRTYTSYGRRTRRPETLLRRLKTLDDPHDIEPDSWSQKERDEMEEELEFDQHDWNAVVRADEIEDILTTQPNLRLESPEEYTRLVAERNALLTSTPPYDPKKHKTRRPRATAHRRRWLARIFKLLTKKHL